MSSAVGRRALRVEALHDRDRAEFGRLVAADPIVNAVVAARLQVLRSLEPASFGGALLGVRDSAGALTAAAFHGGNLLPIGGGPDEWRALAGHLAAGPRLCSSIVGRAEAVAGIWPRQAPAWAAPRAVRGSQPLLVLDRGAPLPAAPPGQPAPRAVHAIELERYLPAAAAMFTEELGVSPFAVAPAGDYRRRVAGLIREGRAFAIFDAAGEVAFKADLGAVSPWTCQVQGVWVRPELRGRGLGRAGLTGVLARALQIAPIVSLYVNDYNHVARRLYERLGMRHVATLSTVLF